MPFQERERIYHYKPEQSSGAFESKKEAPITAIVVEDTPEIREVIVLALQEEGVKVLADVASEVEFDELTGITVDPSGNIHVDPKKSKINGTKPTLIVTDLNIGGEDKIGGYRVARKSKQLFNSTVILQTNTDVKLTPQIRNEYGVDRVEGKMNYFKLAADAKKLVLQRRDVV